MTQSANLGQIRVNWGGFSLDTQTGLGYNIAVALGAWCNGNTWVSKTFVEGSSPSAPAKQALKFFSFKACFLLLAILPRVIRKFSQRRFFLPQILSGGHKVDHLLHDTVQWFSLPVISGSKIVDSPFTK